jgi:cytochrome c biogenesis protein CcdA
LGRDLKGKLSLVMYVAGMVLALWLPALAWALYALVALMWLVPDRRIERLLQAE